MKIWNPIEGIDKEDRNLIEEAHFKMPINLFTADMISPNAHEPERERWTMLSRAPLTMFPEEVYGSTLCILQSKGLAYFFPVLLSLIFLKTSDSSYAGTLFETCIANEFRFISNLSVAERQLCQRICDRLHTIALTKNEHLQITYPGISLATSLENEDVLVFVEQVNQKLIAT